MSDNNRRDGYTPIHCSFCGKTEKQVKQMVKGRAFLSAMNVLRFAVKCSPATARI